MASKFGLGEYTNIDLFGELKGFLPTISWKKKVLHDNWRLGDTLNLAIGQGSLLVTPIQLIRLVAAIANKGKLLTPTIKHHDKFLWSNLDIGQHNIAIIQHGMKSAINDMGGIGYVIRIRDPDFMMAGKSGTSQVTSSRFNNKLRDHALFVGYAPVHEPKYAVVVVVEHGGWGGRVAGPIGRDLLLAALSSKI